jgi:hypothetical protein
MKFIVILSIVLLCSSSLFFARKNQIKSRGVGDNGTKKLNEPCSWKIAGSECEKGLECLYDSCENRVCKVLEHLPCKNNLDCDWKMECRAGMCQTFYENLRNLGKFTQELNDQSEALKEIKQKCPEKLKKKLFGPCNKAFIETFNTECRPGLECQEHTCGKYLCLKLNIGLQCKEHKECAYDMFCSGNYCSSYNIAQIMEGEKNQFHSKFAQKGQPCPSTKK